MNFTASINVVSNNKSKYYMNYKFNGDMYKNELKNFFSDLPKSKLVDMFNELKPIDMKKYEEYVKLAGLYDDYNFDENIWINQDGHKKFNMLYQELDNRCFINQFTGKNDLEVLYETGRRYILNNDSFVNNVDFKYIINLDEYKMGINSKYYDSIMIDL